MNAVARLTVTAGGELVFALRPGRHVIGRARDCDLVLGVLGVSRHHAVVELTPTEASIVDAGSRNGTHVNGRADATVHPLAHGSVIRLGTATFVFEWLGREGIDDDQPTPPADDFGPEPRPSLTAAQERVLALLLGGLAEKTVAAQLDVSPHTVHNHVKRIYAAYRVNSRSELLSRFVARRGAAQPGQV